MESDLLAVGSVYSLSFDGKASCSNESRKTEVLDEAVSQVQFELEERFVYTLPWDPGGCWH